MLDVAEPPPTPERVRLEERCRRIRALLETRFDYLPDVRTSMPTTSTGPADSSKRVPCDVCRGRGQLIVRKRGKLRSTRICLGCDGTGLRLRRRDDPPFDEYVGRLRESPRPRVMTAREYDDQLTRIRSDQDIRAGRFQHERYGWERARLARDVAGSYRELDEAVAALRRHRPLVPLASREALEHLSRVLPPAIRLPGAVHEHLSAERKRVALSLHRSWGWTAGEIGRALGVSREKVGRWLKPVPSV